MARQKVTLLQSAWRRGPRSFFRQVVCTARDSLWSQRHFVYRLDLNALPETPPPPAGLASRDIDDWSGLAPISRERLIAERDAIGWGRPELFQKGYKLWLAEIDGALATLRWWKIGGPGAEFFISVPEDCVLSYQASVLPEFRGQRLQEIGMVMFARRRKAEGIIALMASCREYNTTSRRMFARTGWTWLGYAEIRKSGAGTPVWHPAPSPIPAAELEGVA